MATRRPMNGANPATSQWSTMKCWSLEVFARFLKDSPALRSKYSLIAALVGVVIITAVTKLGTSLSTKFNTIANSVTLVSRPNRTI